jgi:hypothetical protein
LAALPPPIMKLRVSKKGVKLSERLRVSVKFRAMLSHSMVIFIGTFLKFVVGFSTCVNSALCNSIQKFGAIYYFISKFGDIPLKIL